MNVITSFKDRRVAKQLKFERQLLRGLSLNKLKSEVKHFFGSSHLTATLLVNVGIEEACFDVAIEAYLLGGNFSRFAYYGETVEMIKQRCESERRHLIDTLYNFFLYWGDRNESVASEQLYYLCEHFVENWWRAGFTEGERQYKLRLH